MTRFVRTITYHKLEGMFATTVPETNVYSKSVKIFPSECRQRATTYKAKLSVTVRWSVDGQPAGSVCRVAGQVPIMVKV